MEGKNSYVYGNAARAYVAEPARRSIPEHEKNRRIKTQPKKKVDKVSVVVTMITMAVAFLVCFSYLQKQFRTTYLSKNLVSLESEVLELEKQNAELNEQIHASIDLSEVYRIATKELGMVHATDNRVFIYVSQKGNQVRQYEDIPEN